MNRICFTARAIRAATIVIVLIAFAALTSGCGSTFTKSVTKLKLPALTEITKPQTADRALVIAQAIRVERRDHLARRVSADGHIDAAEMNAIKSFDSRDQGFTVAWSSAQRAIGIWKSLGGGAQPLDFSSAYALLFRIASQWQTELLEIKPVVVDGNGGGL